MPVLLSPVNNIVVYPPLDSTKMTTLLRLVTARARVLLSLDQSCSTSDRAGATRGAASPPARG